MKSLTIFILFYLISGLTHAGGTSVGNGGDPIYYYLEVTRRSLTDVIKEIALSPEKLKIVCAQNSFLNLEQIEFCNDFFAKVNRQILILNFQEKRTEFILKNEPLYVTSPDGTVMTVAAKTDLGAEGNIEFHRDSIKSISPFQLLMLMTHEFGHKVRYSVGSQDGFITDNDKLPPFTNGREFLDQFAHVIATWAQKLNKIGTQYGINDVWNCSVITEFGEFPKRMSSIRLFESESWESYTAGIGLDPSGDQLEFRLTNLTALIFQAGVWEPRNCQVNLQNNEKRFTDLKIIRRYLNTQGLPDTTKPDEIMNSTRLENFNPLCEDAIKSFELKYDKYKFRCEYFLTQGNWAK